MYFSLVREIKFMKKIFCPSCGNEVQVNDERSFSFCTECGNKIVLQKQAEISEIQQTTPPASANDELDKKLEEVAFYYKLSFDKKE